MSAAIAPPADEQDGVKRLAVGVMGHVDHGKTALVRALTGMETDRLPEEQRRGVSIVLGFAHARFGTAEIDFIDMPGHERFVRAMVSGATGVGAALLVVAANEGVKPQTVEHLEIAALLGLPRVLPVIAKADLVSADAAVAAGAAALALVRASGLEAEPPIAVSALMGEGMEALRAALARLAETAPAPADDGFPYLPLDRAFSIAGRGVVVTGTLRRGRLTEEAPLALTPSGEPVRMRGLQVHGQTAHQVRPGQRVAVNLRGMEADAGLRGAALAPPGLLQPSRWLSVRLTATPSAPPLKTGMRLLLLHGAAEVEARLRLLEDDALEPGAVALAQLETAEPVAAPAREPFVLRVPSPARTVAGGRVIDPAARRLRRRDAAELERLNALGAATAEERIALTLAHAGPSGVELPRLQALAGLSPARIEAVLAASGARRFGSLVLARQAFEDLARRLLQTLQAQAETQPNGLAQRRLAALLPDASPAALEGVTAALVAAGRIQAERGAVRLAPRRADAEALAAREAALAADMARRLETAGLTPPDLADLAATPAAKRALERLLKAGDVVRTLDRVQKRELIFHRRAVEAALARLRPDLQPPGLTVGEAGARLGVSRKFSVPLLEYMDALRLTRREGDRRVLGPQGAG